MIVLINIIVVKLNLLEDFIDSEYSQFLNTDFVNFRDFVILKFNCESLLFEYIAITTCLHTPSAWSWEIGNLGESQYVTRHKWNACRSQAQDETKLTGQQTDQNEL